MRLCISWLQLGGPRDVPLHLRQRAGADAVRLATVFFFTVLRRRCRGAPTPVRRVAVVVVRFPSVPAVAFPISLRFYHAPALRCARARPASRLLLGEFQRVLRRDVRFLQFGFFLHEWRSCS